MSRGFEWGRPHSDVKTVVPGIGGLEAWSDVTDVSGDLVTFRTTYVFESDGAVLTSESTLRFRGRAAVTDSLAAAGFTVAEVRDAPDRPRPRVRLHRHQELAEQAAPDDPQGGSLGRSRQSGSTRPYEGCGL